MLKDTHATLLAVSMLLLGLWLGWSIRAATGRPEPVREGPGPVTLYYQNHAPGLREGRVAAFWEDAVI